MSNFDLTEDKVFEKGNAGILGSEIDEYFYKRVLLKKNFLDDSELEGVIELGLECHRCGADIRHLNFFEVNADLCLSCEEELGFTDLFDCPLRRPSKVGLMSPGLIRQLTDGGKTESPNFDDFIVRGMYPPELWDDNEDEDLLFPI